MISYNFSLLNILYCKGDCEKRENYFIVKIIGYIYGNILNVVK